MGGGGVNKTKRDKPSQTCSFCRPTDGHKGTIWKYLIHGSLKRFAVIGKDDRYNLCERLGKRTVHELKRCPTTVSMILGERENSDASVLPMPFYVRGVVLVAAYYDPNSKYAGLR